MKATIRVPMRESFAYIEFEEDNCQPEEAMQIYKRALALTKEDKSDKTDNW
jgi:hypothetical protein